MGRGVRSFSFECMIAHKAGSLKKKKKAAGGRLVLMKEICMNFSLRDENHFRK